MTVPHRIPPRLIQTGRSRTLTLVEQAVVANLKLLNPDFEWRFFDDAEVADFVAREFPEHRRTFESFPVPIQRIDFFRYLAVYRLGGFYFDLDVLLARGLRELCALGCVFPFEELTLQPFLRRQYGMDWEVGNYAFGAAPGHPFLGAVIENCARAQRDPGWLAPMLTPLPRLLREDFYVYDSTGPGLVTRTLAEYPREAPPVTVLFPEDVCDERSWHRFGAFGVHLQAGSWRARGSAWRRRVALVWERHGRAQALREGRRRGKTRLVPVAAA
jgi:hypothetical protein